jgi:hypothetical protein
VLGVISKSEAYGPPASTPLPPTPRQIGLELPLIEPSEAAPVVEPRIKQKARQSGLFND